MNLPIKLSSEKQKEIEIVEEGFLDCGASVMVSMIGGGSLVMCSFF